MDIYIFQNIAGNWIFEGGFFFLFFSRVYKVYKVYIYIYGCGLMGDV